MASINPEQLIECVRRHEVLYDPAQEYYRNVEYKDKVWHRVAAELNVEGQGEECKKRWNGIRDSLRRARQKREKAGQPTTPANKYKYEKILEFLIPHLGERKAPNKVPDDDDYAETNHSQQATDFHESIADFLNVHLSEDTTESPAASPSIPNGEVPVHSGDFSSNTRKRKRMMPEPKYEDNAMTLMMAHILSEKKKKLNESDGRHPVDAFLAGIAPSLKSLDPIRLLAAKGKIFNIVHDLELEQLIESRKQ